jgi:type VI secretion system protein VasD
VTEIAPVDRLVNQGEFRVSREVKVPSPCSYAFLGLLLAAASGCAHQQKGFRCDLPPPLFLTIAAGPNLNPSEEGEALPTLVRVFQLSSMTKAETLESKDFWEHPSETLGPDLIAQEELTLEPGERVSRWVNRRGPTNYIVAVALFRAPTGTSWRTVVPLAPVLEDDCPADAPPPRTGKPLEGDVRLLVSLLGYEIEGTRVGGSR